MTKAELIKYLESFDDDIPIKTFHPGMENIVDAKAVYKIPFGNGIILIRPVRM